MAEKNRERMQMTKVMINISSGQQQINSGNTTTMFQNSNGEIFFGVNDRILYRLIEYSWSGPQYSTVTNSIKTGTHKKKGKAGRIGAGAVIGSVLGPGGTAVGVAMTAGSGTTTNINENTHSVSNQIEINTPATLKFKNIETGQIASIVIACNSLIDSQIKCFTIHSEEEVQVSHEPLLTESANNSNIDVAEEIKKFKELADSGIITEEEFQLKKKQLLGL